MAFILRKNFNLGNLVRLISRNSSNQSIRSQYTNVATSRSIQNKRYATAALNYKVNYASDNFENNNKLNNFTTQNPADVDIALQDIDYAVRRTGRTALTTVHNVFQLIENAGNATEKQSLYLLRCCSLLRFEPPKKRIELLNKIWEKFKTLGVKLDVRHFNAFLKVYLDSNENFSPSDVLISMENHNVEPNQETFACLVEKYCRDGDLDGANEILQYVKEKNIPVNEAVFNSLIKGHMKINDAEGAKSVMEVMRSSNIYPSSRTYTTLACCFADKGELNEVKKVMAEAESSGISFSNTDYLQILLSAASSGNNDFIDKMLQKMDDSDDLRQDFTNAAAELVHKGCDNVAHKLIMGVSSIEYSTATNNFLKVLIKAEVPVERVIQYCTDIYNSGYNNFIFKNGAKVSVENGKLEHGLAFFSEIQQRGIAMRARDFIPFFVANKHSADGIWKIMKIMAAHGIPLDYLIYRDYILPIIGNENPQQLISKIEECGHSVSCVVDPLFEHYCLNGEVDNALYLIENHSIKVNKFFNLVHYLSLYNKFNQNPTTYFKVLKYILENVGLPNQDVNALRGEYLAVFLQSKPRVFEVFHKSEIGMNCTYHGRSLEICRKIIRVNAPNLLDYLRRIGYQNKVNKQMKKISVEEEEELINSTSTFSKQNALTEMLRRHVRNKDIEGINRIKKKFEEQNIIPPPSALSQLLLFECEMGNLDGAKECLQKIKELYPTFNIETAKLFDYARLLLKYSKNAEALAVIEKDCQEVYNFSDSESLLRSVRRFLNNVVQTGDVELAKAIQASLINHASFSNLKGVLLEPVLKIYLFQGDFENALKEYENGIINHRCSPCENMFMKKLILADDHSKLQAVVDLASKIEGNSKTLHKLGLAFLDLDRLQQASKIFQKLGRNIDYLFLEEVAKEYIFSNKITVLEDLLRSTSHSKSTKREGLYNLLLTNYCKKNQYEKCSEILSFMKDENIEPSNEYKRLINNLCVLNSKPLHFPDVPENEESSKSSTTVVPSPNETVPFLNCVLQENGQQALKELQALKKGYIRTIPLKDMSSFIELLIKNNCLDALAANTQAMSYIIENSNEIFKSVLEKLCEEGNVEAMKSLASVFPDFALKRGFFNSFFARAYLNSNRAEELLSELEARYQKKNRLFSIVAFQELIKLPHLEDRVVKLAKDYFDSRFDLPIAILWAHYYVTGQFEKAHEISQGAQIPVDKVDTLIFKQVQENENISLGKKYVEFVSVREYKDRSKERAYGILLDVLVLKQMHEEAVDLIMDAKSKNVNLEKHYQSTLTTLKSSLERENKPVPFSVNVENIS